MRKEHNLAGQGAIFLSAVLWSTAGLFIKFVSWHPSVIVGSRSILALAFLLTVRLITRKNHDKPIRILPLMGCGFWYAATMICFVTANKHTTSANAILLQFTSPIWAAFLGLLLLKEKPHWEQWLALPFISMGMVLIVSSGLSGGSIFGDSIALLSGLTFAATSIAMRSQKDANTYDVMICAHIIAIIYSIPFFIKYPPIMDLRSILSVIFMGLGVIGVASLTFSYGIKYVTAIQSQLIVAVEPVLNPVWVLLGTGEIPGIPVISGGGIIILAIVISSVITTRRLTQSALRRRN
jgi:drug/metabolite transporter (DMT)-like permease